jgi:hypothetical protein
MLYKRGVTNKIICLLLLISAIIGLCIISQYCFPDPTAVSDIKQGVYNYE